MNSIYGTPITGLHGADFELNIVANNIANVNTSGFQAVEPELTSLPAQAEMGDPNDGIPVPAGTHVGMGTRPAATMRSQQQAQLVPTGNPLDLAIGGPGFFTLRQPDGQLVYAQQVSLHLEPDGQVVTAQGLSIVPPVRVPADVVGVTADAQGALLAQTRAGDVRPVGKLSVVTFAAPENLRAAGNGLYVETLGSGRSQVRPPGLDGTPGVGIMSGYQLESTVDLATEMTNMIEAQRMYEANAKALQTMDALVNNVVSLQVR